MNTSRTRFFIIAVLVLTMAAPLAAEEPAKEDPKLVLVLSGGGARGIAHIGVIRVLEELHIAPDLIVGTSMGSIIGGLYAAGWSPDEMEEIVRIIDWKKIFTDRVERKNRSFRRKQDDRPVLIQGRLYFEGMKPVIPSGVIKGQRLELALQIIEALSAAETDFDELPIPYRAIAADIATGKAAVISSGSLATAMRASMSVPGALPPVKIDGRDLVDGGITANLPVGIAQDLGAHEIIAVDISSPLLEEEDEQFESFMSVFTHLNSLLTVRNRDHDAALLQPDDVLIVPDLGDISFVSFDRVEDAVAIGEEAARQQIDELRKFSATRNRWTEFESRTRAQGLVPLKVDRVRLENTSRVDDRLVRKALTIRPPETLDQKTLGSDLLELYNTRYFGVIGFHLEKLDEDVHELVIETPEPTHGSGSLQFGLGFVDDFDGGASYHLLARHQYLPANRRGGEWETLFQIGTVAGVKSSFYQPLDWGMKWFVEPSLSSIAAPRRSGSKGRHSPSTSSVPSMSGSRRDGCWGTGESSASWLSPVKTGDRHASVCPNSDPSKSNAVAARRTFGSIPRTRWSSRDQGPTSISSIPCRRRLLARTPISSSSGAPRPMPGALARTPSFPTWSTPTTWTRPRASEARCLSTASAVRSRRYEGQYLRRSEPRGGQRLLRW